MMAVRHLSIGVLLVTWLCAGADGSVNSSGAPFRAPSAKAPAPVGGTNAQELLKIAYSHYENREFEQAISLFKMVLLSEPTNYEANLYLGYTYCYLSNFEAAVGPFQTASYSRPAEAEAQYWLGNSLYALHRFAQAIPAFKTSLALETNRVDVWLFLGCSQFHVRDYTHAAESLRRFTAANQTNYSGHIWLGYSLARLGSYDEAAEAFKQAASLNPADVDASSWSAVMLLRAHRYSEAVPSLEHALSRRCRISVINGGLQENTQEFPFEAPLDGYKPFEEINMPVSLGDRWAPDAERTYFVRLSKGQCGRIIFHMIPYGDHFFKLESLLNPSGSRNLEFDPNKVLQVEN